MNIQEYQEVDQECYYRRPIFITPEDHANARARFEATRHLADSVRNAEGESGVWRGAYAEVMIERWLRTNGHNVVHSGLFEHDYELYGKKIEAKGKHRNRSPISIYNMSVPSYQLPLQDADLYIHAQMRPIVPPETGEYIKCYIVGGHNKAAILKGKIKRQGEVSANGSSPKQDTHNLHIGKGISPEKILDYLARLYR